MVKCPLYSKCYKEEAPGHNPKAYVGNTLLSPRVDVDKIIADTKEDGLHPQLAYIDLRFGTKCAH